MCNEMMISLNDNEKHYKDHLKGKYCLNKLLNNVKLLKNWMSHYLNHNLNSIYYQNVYFMFLKNTFWQFFLIAQVTVSMVQQIGAKNRY